MFLNIIKFSIEGKREKKYLELFLIAIFVMLLSFMIPVLEKHIVNALVSFDGNVVKSYIVFVGMVILLQIFLELKKTKIGMNLEKKTAVTLKEGIIQKILNLPLGVYENYDKEYIHNMIDVDTEELAKYSVQVIQELIPQFLFFLCSFVYIAYSNYILMIIILSMMIIFFAIYCIWNKYLYKANLEYKESSNILYAAFSELLDNFVNIRINNLEKNKMRQTDGKVEKMILNYSGFVSRAAFFLSFATSVQVILNLVVICWCSLQILDNKLTLGDMFALITMGNYVIAPIFKMMELMGSYSSVKASYDRLEVILSLEEEKHGNINISNLKSIHIKIKKFGYGENVIISNFEQYFERGNIYFLVGDNGSGKSSLLKIIAGLYKNYEGNVWVNDKVNSRDLSKECIAKGICYVEQTPHMFSGTIWDNLLLEERKAPNILDKEHIYFRFGESLYGLKNGLDTNILDYEGNSISGGEKQKVNILRGILKSADVMLLDEPINNLDGKSACELFNVLNLVKDDKIIIVVMHDRKYDDMADHIIYMKNRKETSYEKSTIN